MLPPQLVHLENLVAAFEPHRLSQKLSVVHVVCVQVKFFHYLHVQQACDELSLKNLWVVFIFIEGLL